MENEKIEKKLDALLNIAQKIFILEAYKSGLSSEKTRNLLGINNNEISKIWKHLKNDK